MPGRRTLHGTLVALAGRRNERLGAGRGRRSVSVITGLMVALTATGVMAFGPAPSAEASHFRSAQLSWRKTGPTTAQFRSTVGVRRSAFGAPTVGSTIAPVNVFFGDGTLTGPSHTVTYVDTANDWVLAEATFSRTYATPGPYTAAIDICCRLSTSINNRDGNFRAQTIVDLAAGTASPVSSISPIVDCPSSGLCQFSIPATDADGQALRYRMASGPEWSNLTQPGPPHAPSAAGINPSTGVYSWDTTGAPIGLYSTQVVVEKIAGPSVVATTAVDFLIRLTSEASANQAPSFRPPTPSDGTIIDTTPGSTVTFDVAADDPNSGNTVSLGMLGRPATATFATTPGNPATGTFSWTPSSLGSTLITLSAQDDLGLGATQRSVTIRVVQNNADPVIDSISIDPGTPRTNDAVTANVIDSDPDGDPVSRAYQWLKNGTPLAGETSASLDLSVAGNGDRGDSIAVDVTASDGRGGSTTMRSASIAVLNSDPAISSVAIDPGAPETGSMLAAEVSAGDADGDALAYVYRWRKNGVTLTGQTGQHLDLSHEDAGDYGDQIVVEVTVSDGQGGEDTESSASVTIGDTTAPQISGSRAPGANAAGWNNEPVTVSFACQDEEGGSGMASCTDPVTLSSDGEDQSVEGTARDNAGNLASTTVGGIDIDRTPPDLSGSPTSPPNDAGWYGGDVEIAWTCSDALSGVVECPANTMIGGEGTGLSSSASVSDVAGNVTSATVGGIRIDRTAPTVSYTGNAGSYTVDEQVEIVCTASDELSGVASDTCADVTGPAHGFGIGEHTFSASATDGAGNVGGSDVTFTVTVTFESLCRLTERFVSETGVAKSLCSKLAAAARSKGPAKSGQLGAFRNQLSAQRGKTLTGDHADVLTDLSNLL